MTPRGRAHRFLLKSSPTPGNQDRNRQRMWFQHECRSLDALVYVNRAHQGGKGGPASGADSLVQDRRDPRGSRRSLSDRRGPSPPCGCRRHASTSTREPASPCRLLRTGPSTPREARPCRAAWTRFRAHCVPLGRPSSRPRDVREPVSAWWAALPGTTQMIPTAQTPGTPTASGPQPVTQSGREHL